jgi:integrase
MSELLHKLKSYTNSYTVKYSEVRIYPSVISKKSSFTKDEKKYLTRKGFRWYVYFDFINPDTGKMERQTAIHQNVNREFPNFDDRRKHIFLIKEALEELLQDGYSPYESKQKESYTAIDSLDFALSIRKDSISESTYSDYHYRLDLFKNYITKRNLHRVSIDQITRSVVVSFLNEEMKRTTARNRNNCKSCLSSLFSVLVDNELIANNFILSISNVKTNSERNKSYSEKQADKIYSFLLDKDPYLLIFIKFISYNFLRPVEVVRLKCGDVDLESKLIHVRAKNKIDKVKRIPDILIDQLSSMDLSNPDHFLFTPSGHPDFWESNEKSRRGYFSNRFKAVKIAFSLDDKYTVYSFRHTFISKLYREFRKSFEVSATLDKVQLITGHESIDGLKNYLRSIDAEIPDDWSDMMR